MKRKRMLLFLVVAAILGGVYFLGLLSNPLVASWFWQR